MLPSSPQGKTRPAASPTGRRRRRRPPNQREQIKRVQWGQRWGRILSDIGRNVREKRG